ncbi:MAG: substrate-binding domain-containing protein [Proteobacteria bacterium]|nr:substrate-binding domain-containing protein [Pseudomonadota bacterium]
MFCNNDHLAAALVFECHRQGWAVPERLAILGFGDQPNARASMPQLSTIRIRRAEMGERAGQLLLDRLAGRAPEVHCVDIGFDIVARASTQAGQGRPATAAFRPRARRPLAASA